MGSSESKPPPPPPTVTPPSIPTRNDLTLSIATSSACLECAEDSCKDGKPCRLAVAPNKSAASVKVYRNRKVMDVRNQQTNDLNTAFNNIGNTITFREFILNLRQGKYSAFERGKAMDVEATPTQFDTLMRLGDNINVNNPTFNYIIKPNITLTRIREVKTSYLSENKLTIVPNIPFEMSYNGKTFNITKMSLFHPSPLRIENVQHDAVLTLNDPVDNPDFVVMIPLVASSFTTPSTTFFSRINYAFDKVTSSKQDGSEETVSTGSDWYISKLFNTMSDGVSIVDSFYTWSGVNPNGNAKTGRYIMMEKPVFISISDLTSLRNLPAINPTLGIPSISEPVSYRKELCCKANSTTNIREKFVVKERSSDPVSIVYLFLCFVVALMAVLFAYNIAENRYYTDTIRGLFIRAGQGFSNMFDKYLAGKTTPAAVTQIQLPAVPQLPTASQLPAVPQLPAASQLDLKNLSNSEEVPPALQNLASNPALQNLAAKFGAKA
jgi:hypothetical protein